MQRFEINKTVIDSIQELIEINKKLDTLVKGGKVGKDNSKSLHDETTKK